jgi:hypothetical protein
MIHGLYDGGLGAGLEDYWKLIRSNPRHAGGFLWVLADEGIVRKDKHDSIDTYGNNAPDGIVGPHREKEASFYTVRKIWSPVQIADPVINQKFTGELTIENNYHFTNLSACRFTWELIRYPLSKEEKTGYSVLSSGKQSIAAAPGTTTHTRLSLPDIWYTADAIQFKAIDRFGRELNNWIWPIRKTAEVRRQNLKTYNGADTSITTKENADTYTVLQAGIQYQFSITDGVLLSVRKNNLTLPFGNGPVLTGEKQSLQHFRHYRDEAHNLIVTADYTGKNLMEVKWVFSQSLPVKLEYSYTQKDSVPYAGIGFCMNEAGITGIKWLGSGPYRVWKNRLQGNTVSVWHKAYNNTVTGETFTYPEFKGYHADLYWATIENNVMPFTVYTDTPDIFLQLLQPSRQKTKMIPYVNPPFPESGLGFMQAIPPIGTKFKGSETMGPQSQINAPKNNGWQGILWFDFR